MSLASEDVDRPPFEVTETGYVVWRNALSSQDPFTHSSPLIFLRRAAGANSRSKSAFTLSPNPPKKPSSSTTTSNSTLGLPPAPTPRHRPRPPNRPSRTTHPCTPGNTTKSSSSIPSRTSSISSPRTRLPPCRRKKGDRTRFIRPILRAWRSRGRRVCRSLVSSWRRRSWRDWIRRRGLWLLSR